MRQASFLVLATVLAGCLNDDLVACGTVSCPSSEVCAAGGCAFPDQLDACLGLADGARCTPTTSAPGTCRDGVCVQFCGDGVIEAGEQCDDGNDNPADGCNACRTTSWQATAIVGGSASATSVGVSTYAVTVDRAGNVYIADAGNSRVRRVDASGAITTVAGNQTVGESGDGGPATSAQLDLPGGIAIDGLGNLYIADTIGARVRRVDPEGIITTIAGNGIAGYSGDNGPATQASLNEPRGIAVDGLGNVYIACEGNGVIRRVDTNGVITTIAGNNTSGYGGDGGPAIAAALSQPFSIAVDAHGDVYIADSGNNRIRRVDTDGVITTVAGNGTSGSSGDGGLATNAAIGSPFGVAVGDDGALYATDVSGNSVRRVDPDGTITTIAGTGPPAFGGDGGPAVAAQLDLPEGVVVDTEGSVYIADFNNYRIRRVTAGVISTIAGDGIPAGRLVGAAATSTRLTLGAQAAVDAAGNIYISDTQAAQCVRVDTVGLFTIIAGTSGVAGYRGDGGPATAALLSNPAAIAVDTHGNVYLADNGNLRVRRIDAAGTITTIAGTGTSGFSGDNGPATSAQLGLVGAIAVDLAGNIYLGDLTNLRVRRIDPMGTITTFAGTGTSGFSGDNGPATAAKITQATGLATDDAGNVYIADLGNSRIRRVAADGTISTFAGTGTPGFSGDNGAATSAQISGPGGLAMDGTNLVIGDGPNLRIRRVDAGGVITTIAGDGANGPTGDGGPALAASLGNLLHTAADGAGNVYIADAFQDRIRRVDPAGMITTVVGQVEPDGMGVPAFGHLDDPRELAIGSAFTIVAGGSSGTVQAIRTQPDWLEVIAGRYPGPGVSNIARYRDFSFGTVGGVAYDETAGLIYLTETLGNRIDVVTIGDPMNADTWTFASLAAPVMLDGPTGLYLDGQTLYVADTGNHAIRAIDLTTGLVTTPFGTAATRGFFGDGGPANAALLFEPRALTRCANGDFFIADTGNNRIRRVDSTGTITTILGDGVAASSGEGGPATTFPVNAPQGLDCDALGNLYASSTTVVREITADGHGIVDGTGPVLTIYGAAPRDTFPASVTTCLTGVAVIDVATVQVADSCTGLLVQLVRN